MEPFKVAHGFNSYIVIVCSSVPQQYSRSRIIPQVQVMSQLVITFTIQQSTCQHSNYSGMSSESHNSNLIGCK